MRTNPFLLLTFATAFLLAPVIGSEIVKPANSGTAASLPSEPDYSAWNSLLTRYYDPQRGMDYSSLKATDSATLRSLRQRMGRVDVASLTPKQQLAYWINLYNINVVGIVVDNYPVESIRDISTDPIIRLNVFKSDLVPFARGLISLDDIENEKIREGFRDPRIHFAINCAARSCPPIRAEAYSGAKLDAELDDQTRRFINGPDGAKVERKGDKVTVSTTRVMDWFGDDFEQWGGGRVAFIRRYASPGKVRLMSGARMIRLQYDEYDWDLNDWKR